jgi:hypothetical protein
LIRYHLGLFCVSRAWWLYAIILALRRLRQENHKFKASLEINPEKQEGLKSMKAKSTLCLGGGLGQQFPKCDS